MLNYQRVLVPPSLKFRSQLLPLRALHDMRRHMRRSAWPAWPPWPWQGSGGTHQASGSPGQTECLAAGDWSRWFVLGSHGSSGATPN